MFQVSSHSLFKFKYNSYSKVFYLHVKNILTTVQLILSKPELFSSHCQIFEYQKKRKLCIISM